jgi:hypothetical protein
MASVLEARPREAASFADSTGSTRQAAVVAVVATAACLALHAYPVLHPWLQDDDFWILSQSRTWQRTSEHLWRPWHEHAMPLGRLSTWVVVQLAGSASGLPRAAALQGPLAAMLGMWLLYLFVRRELGHPFYGYVAAILFGVSLKYNEAVRWFAASFAILAFDTFLLALLAAQKWRRDGGSLDLLTCVGWVALAPGWFAAGVLAGPFCSLYLLVSEARPAEAERRTWSRRFAVSAVPCLGTALFLAATLPMTARAIQHADHYGGKTALQAFAPLGGMELTGRMLVDNLILGINAFGTVCPPLWVPILLSAMAIGGYCWWRQPRTRRSLLVLGTAMILTSYWLALSFRDAWPYESMIVQWTRYNVLPFAGLALVVCGGLPGREGSLFRLAGPAITDRQGLALCALAGLMLVLQLPAELAGHLRFRGDRQLQTACLTRIDQAEAICREHHISAAAVSGALGPLPIPHNDTGDRDVDGWWLLAGSESPAQHSAEEIRRLLALIDPK